MAVWTRPHKIDENNALALWREKILFAGITIGAALSLAALIPATIVGIRERLWGLIAIDCAGFLAIWCIFVFRGLRYEVRAGTALLLVYSVGLNVCLQVGVFSGGPAYLFTCAILAGLFISLKGAIALVLLNAVTLAALGYMFTYGHLAGQHLFFPTMARAMAAGTSFIVLNAVSAISVAVMVGGLHRTTARQAELTEALSLEKADLIDTRRQTQGRKPRPPAVRNRSAGKRSQISTADRKYS